MRTWEAAALPNLFGLDIAKLVADGFASAGGVLDATLIKATPGTRTPGSLTGGLNPTTTNYEGKGFLDQADSERYPNMIVERGQKIVVLLGHTFSAVPEVNDKVTIEGETLTLTEVNRDPAGATYTCVADG